MVIHIMLYTKLGSVFYTVNNNYALNKHTINRVEAEPYTSPEEPPKKEPNQEPKKYLKK